MISKQKDKAAKELLATIRGVAGIVCNCDPHLGTCDSCILNDAADIFEKALNEKNKNS